MAWNPIWSGGADALKLVPYEIIAEDLVEAFNERSTTVDISPLIITDAELLDPPQAIRTVMTNAYKYIPEFINHIDSGGDWTGQTSVPDWNTTDFCNHFGIPYPDISNYAYRDYLDPITPEDCYIQYQILDNLRWSRRSIGAITQRPDFKTASTGVSWLQCEADFIVAPWQVLTNAAYLVYQGWKSGSTPYSWQKKIWKQDIGAVPYPFETTSFDAVVYNIPYVTTIFRDFETSFGYIEDVFNVIDTQSNVTGILTVDAVPDNFADDPLPEPIAGRVRELVMADGIVVKKFLYNKRSY